MSKAKQNLAFELYTSLGSTRSYKKVAELIGVSVKTIEIWGSKGHWQDRLEKIYIDKSEEIKIKRQELEYMGLDVAITAISKIKEKVESDKLDVDISRIFDTMLRSPLSVCGVAESVKEQTACASSSIDIKFDMAAGVSAED